MSIAVDVSPEAAIGPTKADPCLDENLEAAAAIMPEVYKDSYKYR